MAAPEVTALLKRGKRSVASFFKAECFRQCGTHRTLNDFLNFLFDPNTKSIDDLDVLDWCRWLISGGSTFDEFGKTVRQYDNAVICGLVWTANFVAYRCRTCGISPCMSLCSECFQAGNHEGHDFNMFRSQAGGACDCGDVNVMNKAGFCSRHGPDRHKYHITPPPDLLTVAEIMMPRLLLRLIHYLRDSSKQVSENRDTYQLSLDDAEQFLTFLHSLSDMGAAMRSVLSHALTDSTMYKSLTEVTELPDKSNRYFVDSQINYKIAVDNMKFPRAFSDFSDIAGLTQKLDHKTFLQELVFWTVKFEFPQKIVTLLLSLLPDDHYKEAFTRAFIEHYSRISLVLVGGLSRPSIANRVVHISVQLFSNEKLACKMVKDYNLLYILILSLTHMVENILTESTLQDAQSNFHMVVDCGNEAMKDHCYWPIVSDLINLLSHREIAHRFLSDDRLITMWMELLSYFQGMNLNQRELSQHVEFEPETYYAAFSAELEIASSPMWSLLSHCRTKDTAKYAVNMIKQCIDGLSDWFEAISCKHSTKPNPLQLTFHLPLHRYLATFMDQAIQHQESTYKELVMTEKMLKTILIHLLQMQVCVAEIYNGMWVRNGLQIKGQAMTYIQCHFCYSMIDADIYLMQMCACKLDPDYFVQTVLERFHILKWLSFSLEEDFPSSTYKLEPNQELAMVDAALSFLATILGVRTYLGISDKELTRLEMTTLLCVADRQHSQLMDLMPEKSGMTGHGKELFEPTLKQIADYKAPNLETGGGLQQGTYVPKGLLWETDFDPIHVALRAVYRKDIQSAMDRYTEYVKHSGKYSGQSSPWPPFKQPGKISQVYKDMYQILHCRTMHAFLFRLLHKCVNEPSIPESIIYHTIHLLDLALTIPTPKDSCRRTTFFSGVVQDGEFMEWFGSSNILQNAREMVKEVQAPMPVDDSFMSKLTMPSVEEMFQLAPSVVSTAGGPITAAHSGHLPSMPLVSMPTEVPMDTDPCPLVPIHSMPSQSSAKPDVPKYESRGVSTEQSQKMIIKINESIISLLVKLHAKLTGKLCSYVPLSVSNRQSSDSLIGDGPHFISKVLDKVCKASVDCAKHTEETYRSLLPKEAGSAKKKDTQDKEERRRKARERQQKLMAQFASKQKAFMEQNQTTANVEDDDMASTCSSEQPKEKDLQEDVEYDCVICGKSSPSTAENTIGLVALLQATSALGHRLPNNNPVRLPVDGEKIRYKPVNCSSVSSKHLKTLFEHFEESSVQMSVNIGWEGGVLVQTCGHYLHLDCHSAYKASQMNQEMNQSLAVHKGEYWCPLCRQLANSLIPILPEANKDILVKPVSRDMKQLVRDIGEMMVTRPITPRSASLTKAMGSVMEDLTNTTYGAYKTYTNSQTSESVLLFVCSVARTNLEIELLQRGGKLCEQTSTTRKPCFSPLVDILSMHSKILTTKPYTDLWSHITGVSCTEESSSISLYHKDVPLMLKDPVSLLIQLVLTLPSTIEKEHYLFLVKMLYNVTFVQALITTTCKFTPEEREAWKKKGRLVSFGTLDGVLSHVITRMECSRLYEDDDMADKDIPAICQSVWSPQSVDIAVQEYCLPFLRVAALIKYHLFNEEFTGMQGKIEFLGLCQYLALMKTGQTPRTSSQVTSCSCVQWIVDEPMTLTRAWCTDLTNFIFNHPVDSKNLLMLNNIWMPPSLIVLPQHYYKIFQTYSNKTCSVCSSVPKDPAICLVCGNFLCFRQSCCSQQSVYECVHHSIECGAGTGMYLLVNSSIVVVIRGPRATLWGSVYLDEHGEEDRDLKRGKPLFLSAERYNLLKQQWIWHNFDHSCKRWIWHLDRL